MAVTPTGSNCCRSRMPSPAKSRSPRHRDRRDGGRNPEGGRSRYGGRPRSGPRSTPRPATRCRVTCPSSTRSRAAPQITLEDAAPKPRSPGGDSIADSLPPFEYGRIAAQLAKQVIVQKVREAERDRRYQDTRTASATSSTASSSGSNTATSSSTSAAAKRSRRDEMMPRETFRPSDPRRGRRGVFDVRRQQHRPRGLRCARAAAARRQAVRAGNAVPDRLVVVEAVAQDPGSRAKISMISRDSSIDPVEGLRRHARLRMQAVVDELQAR